MDDPTEPSVEGPPARGAAEPKEIGRLRDPAQSPTTRLREAQHRYPHGHFLCIIRILKRGSGNSPRDPEYLADLPLGDADGRSPVCGTV